MEDELFHVLKLSYDGLRDDITKSCFIYCSVFPKEYEMRNDELIEHWIGEGFLMVRTYMKHTEEDTIIE